MAKLRIYDDSAAPHTLSREGYINVATKLLADFANFTANTTNDQERAGLLQGYAGENHTVHQLTSATTDEAEVDEPISSSNCKVKFQLDERKKGNGNFSKHNIVLPKRELGDSLSTRYLEDYVIAICDLYGDGSTTTKKERACNYLFGLMLVGRCR